MYRYVMSVLALTLFLSCGSASAAPPVDINTATAEQLADALVGIGKAKAEAIVQDRAKNGNFKSVDDLERVKGIGPKMIEKNRGLLTVGMEPPAAASPLQEPAKAASPSSPPAPKPKK